MECYLIILYSILLICIFHRIFLDFLLGNSIITTILLYICSYVFGFCKWHRLIITANFINLLIANIDSIYKINISDLQLLLVYYFIYAIFIIINTYNHINKKHEFKIKNIKRYSFRNSK